MIKYFDLEEPEQQLTCACFQCDQVASMSYIIYDEYNHVQNYLFLCDDHYNEYRATESGI